MNTLLNLPRLALFACMAATVWAGTAAATPLALTKSFEGNINFVGTQASLQSRNGGAKACELMSSARASIALPANATVVSAILYWAGTGEVDPEVSLNAATVTAPPERRYASTIDGLRYFAAAADVTALVTGSGSFSFGGLSVSTADIYCAKQQKANAMIAGFALAVVYAHANENYRVVNFYEGMQAIKNTSITVPMRDYTPPANKGGSGRFGYLVWEGDKTGQQKGDHVSFAGQLLHYAPFIQKNDAFNSKSSANSDEVSNGIDFDIVDVAPPASGTNADAVFTTADDRVLLSMAAIALPSKPADLSIKKTQSGEFKLGNEIAYTLTVTNEGPRADNKVAVKDTLPTELDFVSASGPDWTCMRQGQLVSCSYGKPLAPGATASVQIKAKIIAEGKIVNTAEVSGTGDGVPQNNRSTVEGDTRGLPDAKGPFAFTVGACAPNERIKAAGEQGCALFKGPVYAGSKPTIYVTSVLDGVAKPPSASSVKLRFSLECHNPATTASKEGSYAGRLLSTCLDDGSAVTAAGGVEAALEFKANEASVAAQFHYPDVGIVSLRLRDGAGNVARARFASLPTSLRAAYEGPDGAANPGKAALTDPAFVEAGEAFLVTVSAHGPDGADLPNFGRESGAFALGEALALRAHGEDDREQNLLQAQDTWTLVQGQNGKLRRPHAWNEAGLARLEPVLTGYLGERNPDTGEPLKIGGAVTEVGRFYPHYFVTETSLGFGCLPKMNCPVDLISRATFSGQAFGASIRAHGRNGAPLQRFGDALVPAITLSAVAAPGGTAAVPGSFSDKGPALASERELGFRLPVPFDAKAGTRGWTAPTAVHVRAEAKESRKTPDGAQEVRISSRRPAGLASREGGIMVINGRLMVANAIGSTASTTPVPLRAQFWTGTAWDHQSLFDEPEAFVGTVEFVACRRGLRDPDNTSACHPVLVRIDGASRGSDPVALPILEDGKASLILAPVIGKSGSVDIFVKGRDYLPSTFGRVTFGQFKSPVIYIREIY